MTDWVGDRLRPLDQGAADQRVRDAVGVVPDGVRLVLASLADGVKLTPGGRLPRVVVRAIQEQRPEWAFWDRPASREEDLSSLAVLHDLLRELRLLRLSGGVLRPTRAASDDRGVVRRLRSWFAAREFHTLTGERAVALVAARGAMPVAEIAAEVLDLLGPGWQRGGVPLTPRDVELELHRLSAMLVALDLIVDGPRSSWAAGASARSLLPRAALLAELV